ncbi:hypothetical protein BDR22DRAFT_840816 [Usnea florida]
MDPNSQAPQAFDPPENYDYQSPHLHADPTSVYSDWSFRPDPDQDDFFCTTNTVHGVLREEPVSTGLTLDQVLYQHDYRSSFAPDYPPLHQESDLSAITASSGTVKSSTSYGVGDSESGNSSWSVNSPSITRSGWGGSIQGQRDYSESIDLESMQRISGVDSAILDPRAVEEFDRFQASVDATRHGGGIEQGESSFFDDVANPTFSELDALPIEGSAVAPITTMPRGNRLQAQPTRGRPGSGPVTDFCEKCGAEFTGDNSRNTKKKHMREKHSPFHHKCQLVGINGSPCPKIIKCPTNRRRHVEEFHTIEAQRLPTRNPKREPVPFLDVWFKKVRKSDEQ